jgi:hypothetical protein
MNNPLTYPWQTAYVSAFLELNPARAPEKLHTALRAIQERMREPLERDSDEFQALQDARQGIEMLKAGIGGNPV